MQGNLCRCGGDYHPPDVAGAGKTLVPANNVYNGAPGTMPSRPHRQSIPGEGMMVQLKKNLLSVALASATLMIATVAHAQSADKQATTQADEQTDEQKAEQAKKKDPDTLDTVTVVGIRAGI